MPIRYELTMNVKTVCPLLNSASANYILDELDPWQLRRHKTSNSNIKEYNHFFPKSEPAEDFDDRLLFYPMLDISTEINIVCQSLYYLQWPCSPGVSICTLRLYTLGTRGFAACESKKHLDKRNTKLYGVREDMRTLIEKYPMEFLCFGGREQKPCPLLLGAAANSTPLMRRYIGASRH